MENSDVEKGLVFVVSVEGNSSVLFIDCAIRCDSEYAFDCEIHYGGCGGLL